MIMCLFRGHVTFLSGGDTAAEARRRANVAL
jgi:hypothetical protein